MIIPKIEGDLFHHFDQSLSDPDTVRIILEFGIALHSDLSREKPAFQMIERSLLFKAFFCKFRDLCR